MSHYLPANLLPLQVPPALVTMHILNYAFNVLTHINYTLYMIN